MGFIVQIIGMFFLGFFNSWFYVRKLRKRCVAWSGYLWALSNFGMWAWGACCYLNWIPGGRAWMWADFFGMNFVGAAFTGTHALALILFLAYPCFYLMGADGGRILYGRRTYEGGFWWALAPLKKPKPGSETHAAPAGLIAPKGSPGNNKK